MLNRADRRGEGAGRRTRSLFLWLIFLALLLLVLDETGLLQPVKGRAFQALSPLQHGLVLLRGGISSAWGNLGGAQELRAQNQALQEQISALMAENVRLRAFEVDNQRLRKALDMKERFQWRTVPAAVLSLSAESDRRALIIDRGTADGIAVGMVVVGQEGGGPPAMVGLVDEVYPQNARVLLITDYRSIVSARVLHSERATDAQVQVSSAVGEVQGRWQLGTWLLMTKLDRSANMAPGDPVVTAGLSQRLNVETPLARIPADVPIGTIMEVRHGRLVEADVQPYLNPDQVQNVWVIVGSD